MVVIKRPAKKVIAKKVAAPAPIDPNKHTDKESTTKILAEKKTPSTKAVKIAKVVSFHFSVGNEDRGRTMEKFIADILKMVKPTPYGKPGLHATKMSEYYILDGVVCLPPDYDEKNQRMKPGHFPPAWAGGPPPVHKSPPKTTLASDGRKMLSASEYDAKYGHGGNPAVIRPKPADDLLEEFEWEESDIDDTKAAKSVADDAVKHAKRSLKIKPRKAVTPSPAPAKRVIKRKAK